MSCSFNPTSYKSAPRVMDATCADLVEQALNSQGLVVGAYKCLSSKLQTSMTSNFGVTDDASFNTWVTQYSPSSVVSCGNMVPYDSKHNVKTYLFTLQDGSNRTGLTRVFVCQATGKVSLTQIADSSQSATVTTSGDPTCTTKVVWPQVKSTDYIE